MPDVADLAEAREARQRTDAIELITHRKHGTPLLDKEYRRICCDCEALIPVKRLAAAPHAVRCVSCQEAAEGGC